MLLGYSIPDSIPGIDSSAHSGICFRLCLLHVHCTVQEVHTVQFLKRKLGLFYRVGNIIKLSNQKTYFFTGTCAYTY